MVPFAESVILIDVQEAVARLRVCAGGDCLAGNAAFSVSSGVGGFSGRGFLGVTFLGVFRFPKNPLTVSSLSSPIDTMMSLFAMVDFSLFVNDAYIAYVVYIVYILYIAYIVYFVNIAYIVYIVYVAYIVYILYIAYIVYFVNIVNIFFSGKDTIYLLI